MKEASLTSISTAVSGLNILCVGDIMLDRFVYGKVDRISPEAPIPVLRQDNVLTMLGAVGNVARNVASMGGRAIIVSAIGTDEEGAALQECISRETGIEGNLIELADRRTTLKVRYIANGQQLLRVDAEDKHALSLDAETRVCEKIRASAEGCRAILLSDYAKGFVTDAVIATCVSVSKERNIPLIVDPKGTDFGKYDGATLIKPNASELAAATGLPVDTNSDVESALANLLDSLDVSSLLVTRSAKGLSFLENGKIVQHVPTETREVYDVSGAGDTSLAALGLAIASGADLKPASEFAMIAAGVAVGKIGTAAVTQSEIQAALRQRTEKRSSTGSTSDRELYDRIEAWRARGLRVGFTNGCFDILHAGHLSLLEFAASHCDRLVVGLNSDASVKRLKGETRPIHGEQDRATMLQGLKPVDGVLIFEEDTPKELIEKVKPDLLVKGGDYTPDTVVGSDFVKASGGEVLIAPLLAGRSTTRAIEKSATGRPAD
ncbi:D-glycero-beta-D-manno-heptose 1-phosphate adenylyltransferase [Ponticaulis profundi]|uniref:Bifunctional protein HldE n=1 Tax=Ponticaulis profundi TaxID=2665222 RepID=A0ABW1SDZ9_9PROT